MESAPPENAVEVEVRIAASPDTVFDFFTDADKLIQWIGRDAELDPRPGGVFHCDINGRDVARGEYLEIDAPRRVVFTWGWESELELTPPPGASTVEVTLEAVAEGTLVRLVHRDLATDADRANHAKGWDHYLERLTLAAAGGDPGPDPWATPEGSDRELVAVVTGAARGIGRGIALVLGEAGATVYVTDRDSRARKVSELPGTVEDTADQLSERGGRGIAVALDHREDEPVAALFERVRREHGGLDLLVANAAAGNDLPFRPAPFWELPLDHWRNMFDVGVRSHLVSARFAAPLLMERGGLAVLTGYTDPSADVLGNHLYYDLAMRATSRLAYSLAHDLRPHGVTALALSPGFTRTEAIVAALGEHPPGSDSVEYPGRAVRALLEDPAVERHAGRTLTVAELAKEYGFVDPEAAAGAPA